MGWNPGWLYGYTPYRSEVHVGGWLVEIQVRVSCGSHYTILTAKDRVRLRARVMVRVRIRVQSIGVVKPDTLKVARQRLWSGLGSGL